MTDLFGDQGKLRYAMTIEAATVGVLALIFVGIGLSHYRRCVNEVETLIASREQAVAHA